MTENTQNKVDDVRQAVLTVRDGGVSQAEISRETGISESILSPFLKGKYTGDNEAIAEKLSQWLFSRERRQQARQTVGNCGYVETPTAAKVLASLTYAHAMADMSVVYGGAGVGKTTTAREYAQRTPNVWLCTATPSTAGVGSMLELVAWGLGLKGVSGHPPRIRAELIHRLSNTNGLLIVDEAQHLSQLALEELRSLHDTTGVGMVLMGNEEVYSKMTGGARKSHLAQLFSRIGKRQRLVRPVKGDVEAIARAWSVEGKPEREFLHELADKPGALRGMVKVLRLARMMADDGPITLLNLQTAWRDLVGEAA